MIPIDATTLRDVAPRFTGTLLDDQRRITDAIGPLLVTVLGSYQINTPLRIAHFLGQCCEESAGFRTLEEFASGEAYEGRRDLGNTRMGDGRLFKGRGLIQLTGGANYGRMAKTLNMDLYNHPEIVAEPYTALVVSCEYWKEHGLNAMADKDDLLSVTRGVNGGTNGLADRRIYTANAKAVLARLQAIVLHGTQTADPTFNTTNPVLYRGATGPFVEQLQRQLSALGYPVAIDGDFGAETEYAVQDFQADHFKNDLAADGIVGVLTWKALQAT